MTIVKTTGGLIQGEKRNLIRLFRGIPYGGDCSGEHRFLPAHPVKKWEGIKMCIANGPAAVQDGGCIVRSEDLGEYFSGGYPEKFGTLDDPQSENCLVLDVMTPKTDNKKRPVIVYIHGGGFSSGSGDIILGADEWVYAEDIVLVGIHHRLNIFGYLYLGAFDDVYKKSGMAGIEDLILALEWVRDNALVFGGDPDNVTLMGESGGAMKINILMMIKRARALFHKVIIESGPLYTNFRTKEEGTEVTMRILNALNISLNDWRDILSVPCNQLLEVGRFIETSPLGFFPTEDGEDLLYNLNSCKDVPNGTENIPMLIGASEDELGIFLTKEMIEVKKSCDESDEQALITKIMQMDHAFLNTPHITEANVKDIADNVLAKNVKGDSLEHLFVKIKSMCGSFGLNPYCQSEARAARGSKNTFQYLVTYDTPNPIQSLPRCAWHTADLPLQMRIVRYEELENLSKIISKTFAAFARTGNPSIEGMPWPAYRQDSKEIMIFDQHCEVKRYPYEKMMELLLKESTSVDTLRWSIS